MKALSNSQRAYFESAALRYQTDLSRDGQAQEYLASRGIGADVATTYRLGIVRNPLPGHENLAGRLSIPYLTRSGVVNFNFRCIEPHDCSSQWEGHRKYKRSTGLSTTIFNTPVLDSDAEFLCVTEGELDAITLGMCGLAACGLPGAKQWKPWYPRCLADHEEIYVFTDDDTAGREFAEQMMSEIDAVPVLMGGGDVNSIYCREGRDGILKRLQAARER